MSAPGPLSFFFNKLLTSGATRGIIYTEHLREIQYENQNTLQIRRRQTQGCTAFNVWIRLSTFGNFQQNTKNLNLTIHMGHHSNEGEARVAKDANRYRPRDFKINLDHHRME